MLLSTVAGAAFEIGLGDHEASHPSTLSVTPVRESRQGFGTKSPTQRGNYDLLRTLPALPSSLPYITEPPFHLEPDALRLRSRRELRWGGVEEKRESRKCCAAGTRYVRCRSAAHCRPPARGN